MVDFSALHVALSAVRAARIGLDTTSNNVANVSTPGYTRQRMALQSSLSRETTGGLVGTGVTVADIGRVRNQLADVRVRSSASSLAYVDVRAQLLSNAETVFAEPDHGLSQVLNDLWASFDELVLSPTDPGARHAALAGLNGTATRFRQVASELTDLANITRDSLRLAVDEVNSILTEVAELNDKIVGTVDHPADLLDRRDMLLDQLSSLAGVKVIGHDDGSVRVTLNGLSLVSEVQVTPLSFDPSTGAISAGGVQLTPDGELGGMQTFLTQDLADMRTELDTLAEDLADALNARHGAGYSASGPGGPLLSYTVGAAASTLQLAITSPDDLATAGSPGPPFPEFDTSAVESMAALRDDLVAGGGTSSLATALRELITDVGQRTAVAQSGAASSAQLYQASLDERESEHGVSLDEEMVSLMEYQRMYEAASRVITAVDQALDVLVNRTGVVGR